MNKKIGVGLIIKNQDNKYLLHLRDENTKLMTNQWSLVGGGIKENETPYSAAKRELLEETGLNAKKMEQVGHIYFNTEWDSIIFEARVDLDNQEIKLGEGRELQFFSKEELRVLLDELKYTNPFLEYIKNETLL